MDIPKLHAQQAQKTRFDRVDMIFTIINGNLIELYGSEHVRSRLKYFFNCSSLSTTVL